MAKSIAQVGSKDKTLYGRGVTVFIDGHHDIIRKFKYLKESGQRSIMRKAIRKAAPIMKRAAKDEAPVRSGILKRKALDYVIRTYAASNVVLARIGVAWGYRYYWGEQRVIPELYINALSKGTVQRKTKSGASRGRVRKNAFLARAARRSRRAVESEYQVKFKTELYKEFNKA